MWHRRGSILAHLLQTHLARARVVHVCPRTWRAHAYPCARGRKILRKLVEMECPLTTPASDWSSSDWAVWGQPILAMQNAVVAVPAVVPTLCRLMHASRADDEVLLEVLYVCCALLLGGNAATQRAFRTHLTGHQDAGLTVAVLQGRIAAAAAAAKRGAKMRAAVRDGGLEVCAPHGNMRSRMRAAWRYAFPYGRRMAVCVPVCVRMAICIPVCTPHDGMYSRMPSFAVCCIMITAAAR